MFKFELSAFADEVSESLPEQIEALHRNDIGYMEIRGVGKRNIIHHSSKEIEILKDVLDKEHIKISSIGSPVGKTLIHDDFAADLKTISKALSAAEALESKFIRIFSFYMPEAYMPEAEEPIKHRDEVLKRMEIFVRMAVKKRITLLNENEKGLYGDSPERCVDLMNELGCDNFKIVFDPANFVQCGFDAYKHAYSMLKEHVAYFHVKDVRKADGINVPAGKGDGGIKDILEALAKAEYKGFLSVEPHLYAFEGLQALERDPIHIEKSGDPMEHFGTAVSALRDLLKDI